MWNVFLGVLATLAVLALVRLAFRAGWRRRLHGTGRPWMARRLARRLRATPEQERVLAEELAALASSVADLRREVSASREDLARVLGGDPLDAAALEAAFARGAGRLDALRQRAAAGLARVHQVLDARQRLLLAEMVRCSLHRRRAHGHA